VINESTARRFWPGESPVGRRFQFYSGARTWIEIVGVVGNVHQAALNVDSAPEVYRPVAQGAEVWLAPRSLVIRAHVEPASLASAVRQQFQSLGRSVPIYGLSAMNELLQKSVASRRLEMLLVGSFGCVALLLASIGIYGVVAYAMVQRGKEVGIRVALGATRADVTAMMLRKELMPPLVGILTGIALTLPLAHFLSSELYQVKAADAFTFSAVSLLMVAVGGCAAYFPSRRAARVDPMLALRQE
jgi:putative ABC transport system permease protein